MGRKSHLLIITLSENIDTGWCLSYFTMMAAMQGHSDVKQGNATENTATPLKEASVYPHSIAGVDLDELPSRRD